MLRTLIFTTVLLFSVGVSTSYAKIWRVNNIAGTNADFTTLQNAHNGASSGDTLHLEGSSLSYGALTSSKKLVIIGPGFFLGENPNSQASLQTAKVSTFTINNGSQGMVIMGLDFEGNTVNVYCHDIFIRRNRFSGTNAGYYDYYTGSVRLHHLSGNSSMPVHNIMISQNNGLSIFVDYASSGITITNNYISFYAYHGDGTSSICLSTHSAASALIQNNIFRRGRVTVYNSTIANNILYNGFFDGVGNLVQNNIASGTQFGTANGNQANVSMSTVFAGGANASPDGWWQLKAGSPALGAGYGSTAAKPVDCGMFGGISPYVLAGLPPIPAIYFFENQPVGSNADPVDVSIKVKSVTR